MTVEPLAAVCELAFAVAKDGVDANPPIDPPASMRSYLYIAQLPVRAYTVSQRVLEEDPEFRRRVAERANEENVGRAGVLWLNRPDGWENDYKGLMTESGGTRDAVTRTFGSVPPPMPPPPAAPASGDAGSHIPPIPDPPRSTSGPEGLVTAGSVPPPAPPSPSPSPSPAAAVAASPNPVAASGGAASTRSSIEDELSNLRDLVDRLADERKNVRSSVIDLETEVQTRRVETNHMSTQLETLQSDLDSARRAESDLREELDQALTRISDLEIERDQMKLDLETSQASMEAARADGAGAAALNKALTSERDQLQDDKAQLRTENEVVASRLDVAEQARIDLEAQLDVVSSKWQSLSVELTELSEQRSELSRQILGLAEEREAMSSAQRALVTEIAGQLGRVEAERDSLAGRLDTTRLYLGLTKEALDTAHRSVREELERTGEIVTESTQSAATMATDLAAASDGLQQLEAISPESIAPELTDAESIAAEPIAAEPTVDLAADDSAGDAESGAGGDVAVDEIAIDEIAVDAAADEIAVDAAADESIVADADAEAPAPIDMVEAKDLEPSQAIEDPFAAPSAVESPVDEPAPKEADDAFAAGLLDTSGPEAVTTEALTSEAFTSEDLTTEASVVASEPAAPEESPIVGGDAGSVPSFGDAFGSPAMPEPASADDSFTDSVLVDAPATDNSAESAPETRSSPTLSLDEALAGYGMGAEDLTAAKAGIAAPQPESEPVNSSRAMIQMPDELQGDELAMARHLTSATDVVMLIDGDAVARLGWPDLEVAVRRGAVVECLERLTEQAGAAADVVFGNSIGGEESLPVSSSVRVRITDDTVSSIALFSGVIDGYPVEWPIILVTDDPELVGAVQASQVSVLANGQLLDLFLSFYD